MTPEELREACEMAGLEWDTTHKMWALPSRLTDSPAGQRSRVQDLMSEGNPALPSYVASLLVAHRERRAVKKKGGAS